MGNIDTKTCKLLFVPWNCTCGKILVLIYTDATSFPNLPKSVPVSTLQKENSAFPQTKPNICHFVFSVYTHLWLELHVKAAGKEKSKKG